MCALAVAARSEVRSVGLSVAILRRGFGHVPWRGADRRGRQNGVEPLRLEQLTLLSELANLSGEDGFRHDLAPDTVPAPALGGGVREDHARGRDIVAAGERQPAVASRRVETERVDDNGQPASDPLGDDQFEQRERVLARA